MARPTKATVDYFPHVTQHGKTLFIIENTWGNDGYAAWFKVLERLGKTENHVIDMNNVSEAAFLAAYCKIPQETLLAILDQCSALNAINPGLWRKKLIYSQNFVDGVADAYRKRKEKLPSEGKIKALYFELFQEENGFPAEETPQGDGFPAEETGKGKGKGKGKVIKESKKEKTTLPPDFQISDRVKEWAAKHKRDHIEDHFEAFKLKCLAKGYQYIDWDAAFMNAIHDNWARVGEQDGGGGNGNGNGSRHHGGSAGTASQKTPGARSDGQPYPVDGSCSE